jgi:hypothetical protein
MVLIYLKRRCDIANSVARQSQALNLGQGHRNLVQSLPNQPVGHREIAIAQED